MTQTLEESLWFTYRPDREVELRVGYKGDKIPFRIRWKLPAKSSFSFQHRIQAVRHVFWQMLGLWSHGMCGCPTFSPLGHPWERIRCQTARLSLQAASFKMIKLPWTTDEMFSLFTQSPCPKTDWIAKVLGIKKGRSEWFFSLFFILMDLSTGPV